MFGNSEEQQAREQLRSIGSEDFSKPLAQLSLADLFAVVVLGSFALALGSLGLWLGAFGEGPARHEVDDHLAAVAARQAATSARLRGTRGYRVGPVFAAWIRPR